MARSNIEWVAQVSLLRPGCFGYNHFAERNPGLKSETWATHSESGGCSSHAFSVDEAVLLDAVSFG